MLFSAEQAFVGRDEKQAPLKTPAWEATFLPFSLLSPFKLLKFPMPKLRGLHKNNDRARGVRPYYFWEGHVEERGHYPI